MTNTSKAPRSDHDHRAGRLELVDALRGLAAGYVVFHHLAHWILVHEHPRWERFFVFGQAAVMLFFILSGFVIYYTTFGEPGWTPSFGNYFKRRFRRIYPIFFLALGLSYVSASIRGGALAEPRWGDLVRNLLMLQGSPPWGAPYYDNAPLWSLGFEWFFYMAFYPIARYVPPRHQKHAVAVLGVLGFALFAASRSPAAQLLTYLTLWWSGVEIARDLRTSGRQKGSLLRRHAFMVATLCSFALIWFWINPDAAVRASINIEARHFLTLLTLLGVAALWWKTGLLGRDILIRCFTPLAPISYALYVFHLPFILLAQRGYLSGSGTRDFFLWALPVTVLTAYLTEVKLQPKINRWLGSSRPTGGSTRPA